MQNELKGLMVEAMFLQFSLSQPAERNEDYKRDEEECQSEKKIGF